MSNLQRKKKSVLKNAEYEYFYCGKLANTVDHKIPKSRRGTDSVSNLVACCAHCNTAKGSLFTFEEFYRWVRFFGRPESSHQYKLTNRYKLHSFYNMVKGAGYEKALQLASDKWDNAEVIVSRYKLRVKNEKSKWQNTCN